jgi:hypothetical protein
VGQEELPEGVLGTTWLAAASCMGGRCGVSVSLVSRQARVKDIVAVPHGNSISSLDNSCCSCKQQTRHPASNVSST